METDASFGAWVRRRRRALDLTQDVLARQVGCARITIQKIEAGERRPSREFAVLLAERLAVPLAERDTFVRAARSDLATPQLDDPARPAAISAALRPRLPGNLPAQLALCIGRERELAQLRALLADPDCRLITLSGLGGVGKTRLAIEFAALQAGVFAHGAWFVALADLQTAALLEAAIASALRVTLDPDSDRVQQLSFFLHDKQLLLVLDNAEQIASAVATLLGQLLRDAPGLKALVTSRERLHLQGEWLVELAGLSYSQAEAPDSIEATDAAQLFTYHARMVRPDLLFSPSELGHVAQLCRLVEGLPLALELAASWTRVLGCQAIAEQVARGRDVAALTPLGLPARHHSLRTVLDHSWTLLGESTRATLRGLAIFHAPFDAGAAEAVTGASLTRLAELLDVSLLRRHGVERFELHPLVRQYAAERLAETRDEQEIVQARHAAYFAALVSTHVLIEVIDVPGEVLEIIRPVFADLRAAWEWAIGQRAVTVFEQMVDGLRVFLRRYSLNREGVDLFGRAVLVLEAATPPNRSAQRLADKLRARQAICYQPLGMTEQARQLLQHSLAAARTAGDLPEVALCLEGLMMVALGQGAHREAQGHAEAALKLRESLDDEPAVSMLRANLGLIAHDQGAYAVARRHCQAALDAVERSGNRAGRLATAALRLGYVEYALGNYSSARTLMETALAAVKHMGQNFGVAHVQSALGLILAAQGEDAIADRMLREALDQARGFNYSFGVALVLNRFGFVLSQRGAYTEARMHLEEALSLCEAADNQIGMIYALTRLGEIACATGDLAQGERQLRRATQIAVLIEASPLTLDVLVGLAALATQQSQHHQARRLLRWSLAHPASQAVTWKRAAQLLEQLPVGSTPDGDVWMPEDVDVGLMELVKTLL